MDNPFISSRKNIDIVELSIDAEIIIQHVFGKRGDYLRGTINEIKWKKILKDFIKVIKKAIDHNVDTDGFHIYQLNTRVDRLAELCDSNDNIDIAFIFSLFGLVFELIGCMPNYSERKKFLNKVDDYYLQGFRSLKYHQSDFQKMRTIIEAAKYEPLSEFHSHDELYYTYHEKFNGKPGEFIVTL